MKTRVPVFLLCALAISIFSCKHKADDNDFSKFKPDTNKVKALHDSALFYVYSDSRRSMDFAKQEFTDATLLGSKKMIIRSILDRGNVYWITGNYPIALDSYLEALRLSDAIDNDALRARCYGNMSNVYKDMNLFDKAINYALKAVQIDKKNDVPHLILDYANLGECYETYKTDSAIYYEQIAERYAEKAPKKIHIGRVHLNFGNIYAYGKDTSRAQTYFNMSIPMLKADKDYHSLNQAYLGIAKILVQQKPSGAALEYALLAHKAATDGYYPLGILNSDLFIYDVYKQLKTDDNSLKGLTYLEDAKTKKDSLYGAAKAIELQSITSNEEKRQEKLEEERKLHQKEFEENLQFAGVAAAIPIFFLFVLMLGRIKIRPKLIESLGLVGLLSFFELLTMLVHHYATPITGDKPIYMLPIMTVVAFMLLPFHHKMQEWMKKIILPKSETSTGHHGA